MRRIPNTSTSISDRHMPQTSTRSLRPLHTHDAHTSRTTTPSTEKARGVELQFELAERSGLPVFFHSRACREDFAAVVRRNRDKVSGGVVHSFTGTKEEAEELVSMGA